MRTGRLFAIAAIGLLICIFFACAAPNIFCETAGNKDIQPEAVQRAVSWLMMKTEYLLIEYEDSVNLNIVAGRLNSRGIFSSGFFSSDPSAASTPEEMVSQRVDRLLKRAEGLLDMYPPDMKLTIKIFKDEDSLAEAYFRMMGTRQSYQAFYIHQYSTIYTSEYGMSDSVIIHEMSHAIIDNYFSANPPAKIAELLAAYVDEHLED